MVRLVVVVIALLFVSEAHAQAPSPSAPSTAEAPEYLDYRGYMALTDAAAVAVLIAAAAADSPPLGYTGVGLYALGGPVFHLAHEQGGRAAGSLALRVGAPLLLGLGGFALGASSCSSSVDGAGEYDDNAALGCGLGEIALGGFGVLSGMLLAVLVDDIVLGKVRLDPTSTESNTASTGVRAGLRHAEPRLQVGVSPFLAPHGQGGGMLLVGTF